jgi:lipid II:glycine glycyltransferase (peptidoglycan interpeptide bridge formation enzyme)
MQKEKNDFNKHATHPLQTWEWGEFRKKTGNQVLRTDTYQLTIHPLPFFNNLKVGALIRGPKPTREMFLELKKIAEEQNLIFIKIEPNVVVKVNGEQWSVNSKKLIKLLKQNGAVPGKTLFTPTSFWIDLTKSEEELLKSFHSKTRYNIRLAQRHGVEVVEDNSDKAFETFLKLYRETTQRQGFYAHNEKYFRLMWETLHTQMVADKQSPIARIITAKYIKQTLVAWIVFVWNDFLYYPYGGSTDKYKQVMAANLMMWEAIRYGRQLKLKTFDLWGREEGKGFTKFKEGYNPHVVEFLGTWDVPTSPLYKPYLMAENLRWRLLRLKTKFIKPKF